MCTKLVEKTSHIATSRDCDAFVRLIREEMFRKFRVQLKSFKRQNQVLSNVPLCIAAIGVANEHRGTFLLQQVLNKLLNNHSTFVQR